MLRTVQVNDGLHLDLDYFVEWRPWLWTDRIEFQVKREAEHDSRERPR